MAFFPLASVKNAKGYCTIHNFSPNQWELKKESKKMLWAIYPEGDYWKTKALDTLEIGASKTYYYKDFNLKENQNHNPLILLQLRKTPLNEKLETLPEHEFVFSKVPEWRSSVGFQINNTQTSYQGEINPFPSKASLLTFHPFIQYNNVHNYLVVFNAEKSPIIRNNVLEIYNSLTKKIVDKVEVKNNHANIISLDQYNFTPQELPVFVCRTMAGIPFGLGICKQNSMLSLEHTRPPASFVVHGQRFKVQGNIKSKWFNILKDIER